MCELFFGPLFSLSCSRRYENYQVGTFVLYKSSFWPLEVHVRQWECGSVVHSASCVCGFAAMDGGSGEVVAFDMCGGEMGEGSRPHLSLKQGGGGVSTVRIAESYQGRKVTVSSQLVVIENVSRHLLRPCRGPYGMWLQKPSPLS